jgi:hypothetical protein
MNDLRVPTVAITVALRLGDGRRLAGRVFVPAAAAAHSGPMRPDEWLEEPAAFLPFLPDGEDRPLLLAKATLAAMTVPADAQAHEPGVEGTLHAVEVECGGETWRGQVAFDLPRLLDLLNRPERFFVLRDGEHDHLLNKQHVTRASDSEGA